MPTRFVSPYWPVVFPRTLRTDIERRKRREAPLLVLLRLRGSRVANEFLLIIGIVLVQGRKGRAIFASSECHIFPESFLIDFSAATSPNILTDCQPRQLT